MTQPTVRTRPPRDLSAGDPASGLNALRLIEGANPDVILVEGRL